MRYVLIPVAIGFLTLTLPPAVLAETSLDSYLILADETEKKDDKTTDENRGTGDEEPECE